MPRRRKCLAYRDECYVLDVATLVEEGHLSPGHHVGECEVLAPEDAYGPLSVGVSAVIGADRGTLCIDWPDESRVPVVRIRCGSRLMWRLVCKSCPGGRPVRRLFCPETPPGVPGLWGCLRCWKVGYRDVRRDPSRSLRARLAAVRSALAEGRRSLAELAVFERGLLADLAEEEARGRGASLHRTAAADGGV